MVCWLASDDADADRRPQPSLVRVLGRRLLSLARSHPTAADALLAAVILAISLGNAIAHHNGNEAPALVLQVALVTPLVWRRRAPVTVFTVICAVAFAQWLYGDRFLGDVAILVSLYTVTRRAPRRVGVAAAGVVEIGVVLAALQRVIAVKWESSLVLLSGMVAAAFFLGTNLRTRQAYLAALVERATRLEHERDQQARIAAAAERASIAREMHDIVAHSLAVVITMAEAAAAKRRSDPERAAAAMEQVADVGRQALGETRRLLGVLRTEAPSLGFAPRPGLEQLEQLVEQVRATGLAACLSVTGQPFALPNGAELAIYRIVQEALTNTIKHARGATRVDVELRYAPHEIEIHIIDDGIVDDGATDDGRRASDARKAERPGHGLVGMQERAALYNGSVASGCLPGRGFGVRARMRLDNGARPPDTADRVSAPALVANQVEAHRAP